MSEYITKHPIDSYTEQVQLLNPSHLNGSGRLFGGQLMQWIDTVAAVVARRHANTNVTTARVADLEFKSPAKTGDLIVLAGKMVYSGRSSMEICVKSYVENLDGKRHLINQAHLILVALDKSGVPCPVPKLIPITEEEKREYEKAKRRKERRDGKN